MTNQEIPELDKRGLRNFGVTTGAIIILLFALIFPWLLGATLPRWPWVLGGVLIAWGLIYPTGLKPVYTNWMKVGLLMSRVTTPVIMGIIFFVVIAPMGLLMRMAGKDPMRRQMDSSQSSYRVVPDQSISQSMTRPF